jgi:hypothetical protein
MARIAFAWELGSEFGHAMACAALARMLHGRGHHIAFIFRELHQLSVLADTSAYDVFQAPVNLNDGKDAPIPASYADILLGCGYSDPGSLAGLLGGWLALLGRWQPDLVIGDSAPTALLASRLLGLKRVAYGNGFSIPPQLSPLPAFRFDEPVAPQRVLEADARALASANTALARFGGAPMRQLCEQFQTDEDFLATFPELDSYGNRPLSGYWGPRFSVESGASVHWPAGPGKRVIVYVKKTLPQFDALLAALAASPHRVAAFIPEIDQARRDALASPRRIVSDRPMRLAPLLKECDLFVSTGGNVCVGTLMSGIPQLVLPSQYEQYITAQRIAQIGAGRWHGFKAPPAEIAASLQRILGEPRFAEAARAFARRYPDYSPVEQQRRMVRRIEQIIGAPSKWRALPLPGAAPILSPTSTGQGTSQ